MGIVKDRMKISNMAKFPREFKKEYCTIMETTNWTPIDLESLQKDDNKYETVKQKIDEAVEEHEESKTRVEDTPVSSEGSESTGVTEPVQPVVNHLI